MEQSPRLSLPYVQPAQAQKHVTVNESFRRLDALTQLTVLSQTVAAEPGAPAEGDAYILPASPTGSAWAGYSTGNIAAFQDGAWVEITAQEGFRAWASDVDQLVAFDGTNWAQVSGGSSEAALKFGVNATADTTNRLSVKTDAVLFSHDDVTPGNDDCIVKVNKKLAADTASQLFQTGFSSRAEFGLTGDDDFHVKTSPDGSTWKDALTIDKTTAKVTINSSLLEVITDVDASNIVMSFTDNSPGQQRIGAFNFLNDVGGAVGQFAYFFNKATPTAQSMRFLVNSVVAFQSYGTGGTVFGSPTGGDKGAGTINAKAVYDDNTLLTCYVFDQTLDGSIDQAKWDTKVPDRIIEAEILETTDRKTGEISFLTKAPRRNEVRRHDPMRKFSGRIGSAHDPLTLDGYAKHWREKRHLTSMPNEVTFDPLKGLSAGEWIQRLVETVEIQAVLVEELNQRIKTLENSALRMRP